MNNFFGKVDIKVYDEFDNVKTHLHGNNTTTQSYRDLLHSCLINSYTSVISPQNIALFSDSHFSNSLTGNVNTSGVTANVNGIATLSASKYDSYGTKYTIWHKNPATGSNQYISGVNLGRSWNSTYNQWNQIVAYIDVSKLTTSYEQLNQIILRPKERITMEWILDFIT